MAQRMFTTLVIVATVFTVAVGCARTSARTSSTSADSTPAASPSSASTDLVGTWRGSAWELAGGIAAARTDATLRLDPDHTWSARWTTNHGTTQTASGTYTTSGNRVILKSSSGARTSLVNRGNDLYGMLDSAVAGLDVQVDLRRAQ